MSCCKIVNKSNPLISKSSIFLTEKIELIKYDGSTPLTKQKLDCYTLWILAEGNGEIEIDGEKSTLNHDKKMIFCNPGTIVEFCATQDHLLLYYLPFRIFNKQETDQGLDFKEEKSCFLSNEVHDLDSSLEIKNIAKELLSRYQCDSPANAFIIQKLFSEMMAIVTNILMNCQEGKNCSIIDCVVSYIQEHYNEDITREQLACMVGLSKEYFSRLFKKETGQSFIEFLTNIRIEKVEEFLLTSNAGLREIAENVGYKNEFYLSRKFKEIKGVSPTMYIKRETN